MKKKVVSVLCVFFSIYSYGQEELNRTFMEFSIGSSYINTTDKIDNYFGDIYTDYKKNAFIPTGGAGLALGYRFKFCNNLAILTDVTANMGIKKYNGKQFKRLEIYTISVLVDYFFKLNEDLSISARTGAGRDLSLFLYSRKEPYLTSSLSYGNSFIPIAITLWYGNNNAIGFSLQYNLVFSKGSARATGLDYEMSDIPNVSLNSLYAGVKFRF